MAHTLEIKNLKSKIVTNLTLSFLIFAFALNAAALTPAELLTPELERQPINFAGLSDGMISYFDADRRLTRQPVDRFVRLTFFLQDDPATPQDTAAVDAPPAPTQNLIELVDGQRLVGRRLGATTDGEGLRFDTHFDELTVRLDDIRMIAATVPVGESAPAASLAGDMLQLDNGDRLTGFLVALQDDAIQFQPDGADDAIRLPWDRIVLLTLANPAVPPANDRDLITLADGSRLRGDQLSIAGDRLAFRPTLTDSAEPITLDAAQARRIDFAAAGYRLVELVDQPMRTVAGGSAMGLELPPSIDGSTLHLHAPITLVFDLPEGSQRFAATAELDLPAAIAPRRAAWADVLLRVGATDGDQPTTPGQIIHLQGDGTTAGPLNVAIDNQATLLRIELDIAANGPILDRLLLRDAVLLIATDDQATPATP